MDIEKKSEKEQQLATENIPKLMFILAIPSVASQVINMLYNIIDRMYIGHIPVDGMAALTGLGLCFPVIMLVSAFSALFGMGGAPKVAIALGHGEYQKAEKIIANCATALVCISLILTVTLLAFGRELLFAFGASDGTITFAWQYLQIYLLGTICVQMTLGLNTFITAQGFTKISMATVMIGAFLNIILDPIFIFGFNMGVQGAALATIISQGVSAIWVLRFLTGKTTILRLKKSNLGLKPEILLPVVALGISPFVMQSTESLLNIAFNVSLEKFGGDLAVGAMTILASIMQLCMMPVQGICQGCQPIISYNFGAGNINRVREAVKLQIFVSTLYTSIFWLLTRLFPEFFISVFNDDIELVGLTTWAMGIFLSMNWLMGVQFACQNTFLALGQAKISLLLALLRKVILLIPLILLLPQLFETNEDKVWAVFLAEPIADGLSISITIICFMMLFKKILNSAKSAK